MFHTPIPSPGMIGMNQGRAIRSATQRRYWEPLQAFPKKRKLGVVFSAGKVMESCVRCNVLCGGVSKKLLPAQSGAEDVLSIEINYCNRSAACPAFPSLGSELASLLQIVSHVQCATARGIDKAH